MLRPMHLLGITVILFTLAETALALPRFASRTGAKCQSCHVNPSGGGMRQTFGAQYGREELPVPAWSQNLGIEDFSPMLTNVLGVGADVRTLYYYRQLGDANNNQFWQMQGDIYLNFRLAKKISLYFSKGLYSGFEVFGILQMLPASGHVKVGKFLPNYGLKMDDHTAFIRTYTGFSPEMGRPELTGLEAAVSPGPFTVAAGFYNAADGLGSTNSKAVLGRIEGMFPLGDDIHLGLGGNVFAHGTLSQGTLSAINGITGSSPATGAVTNTLFGGFGSIGSKVLTLFGEFDVMKSKLAGTTTTGLISYLEADYMVVQGFDLKAAYDFFDPDKDLKSGSISRYSFGFEFFPFPGVEVRPMYRIMKEEPVEKKNDEFHFLIHFYL